MTSYCTQHNKDNCKTSLGIGTHKRLPVLCFFGGMGWESFMNSCAKVITVEFYCMYVCVWPQSLVVYEMAQGTFHQRFFYPNSNLMVRWSPWNFAHVQNCVAIWRHQMETFSALLALCEENPPVDSLHNSQWREALMFYLTCASAKG